MNTPCPPVLVTRTPRVYITESTLINLICAAEYVARHTPVSLDSFKSELIRSIAEANQVLDIGNMHDAISH